MLLGILIGQRTPGHTLAEARAFEERINQRYVDHIAAAGWEYYGVYEVEGLVPGAFGEILAYRGDDLGEALRRDEENERDRPEDITAFYRECSALFWQRGRIGIIWRQVDELPLRGVPIRVRFGDETFELEVAGVEPPPGPDLVPHDAPRVPESVAPGTSVVFHPFVPAPLPS